jgi:hypothetical protein
MNWANEPATWKQLKLLKQLGHQPNCPLTKTAASELIASLGGRMQCQETPEGENLRLMKQRGAAYHFHVAVENAREALATTTGEQADSRKAAFALAASERLEFWLDTCRDAPKTQAGLEQVHEFYQKFGCRFADPPPKDAQYILDALDSAAPLWDREHPELFYETLEINFPQLLRRR